MTLEELRAPGPARAAAAAAIAARLLMDHSICRDRAEASAPRLLDAALNAAEATERPAPDPTKLSI